MSEELDAVAKAVQKCVFFLKKNIEDDLKYAEARELVFAVMRAAATAGSAGSLGAEDRRPGFATDGKSRLAAVLAGLPNPSRGQIGVEPPKPPAGRGVGRSTGAVDAILKGIPKPRSLDVR